MFYLICLYHYKDFAMATQHVVWFSEKRLQAQLADCRAQIEHWQGVATICELSKQEELAELQKQCDQEIQSLQEALRGLSVCQRGYPLCLSVYRIPSLCVLSRPHILFIYCALKSEFRFTLSCKPFCM